MSRLKSTALYICPQFPSELSGRNRATVGGERNARARAHRYKYTFVGMGTYIGGYGVTRYIAPDGTKFPRLYLAKVAGQTRHGKSCCLYWCRPRAGRPRALISLLPPLLLILVTLLTLLFLILVPLTLLPHCCLSWCRLLSYLTVSYLGALLPYSPVRSAAIIRYDSDALLDPRSRMGPVIHPITDGACDPSHHGWGL